MRIDGIDFDLPELSDKQIEFLHHYLQLRNVRKAAKATWSTEGKYNNALFRYRVSPNLVRIVNRIENPFSVKAQSIEWQIQQLGEVAESKRGGAARVMAVTAIRKILKQDLTPEEKKQVVKEQLPETLTKRLKEEQDGYQN